MQNPPSYVPNFPEFDPASLTPEGRRAIVEADVQNAINAGLSGNAIQRAYIEAGVGINRSLLNSIIADKRAELASNTPDIGVAPSSIPLNSPLTSWNRDEIDYELSYRYREVIEAAFYNNATGTTEVQRHVVYHNEPMTIAEIISEAFAFYDEDCPPASTSCKQILAASLARSSINRGFVTNVQK